MDNLSSHKGPSVRALIEAAGATLTILSAGRPDKAKAVVDGAPKAVLEGATKEAAEKAKDALEAAGASVTLK